MFLNIVCNALQKAKIPYAIVGGYAVALHGVPRGTFDVDFVIHWSLENLKKTECVLKELGLISRIPINAENLFLFKDEYIQNRNLIAWNFYDPVKVSHQVDIIITYNLEMARTKTISTQGGKVKVLALKDLIAMKRDSGRPQDLEDIKFLEDL